MDGNCVRRQTCRFCGSHELDLVMQLQPTPIGDAYLPAKMASKIQELYPIDLFLCRNCGLAQLLDIIKPEILYKDYLYTTSSSPGLRDHFERYVDEVIEQNKPLDNSLIVDVGSNDGTLLKIFKGHRMRVVGVEPASEIAHQATANGIYTIAAFFSPEIAKQICQKFGPATILTANNVLANIDDIPSLLESVRTLLAHNGVFVFESFYLMDVVKNMVFDFIYHEHLSAFSVKSVDYLMRNFGMELINVQPVNTKGGSIRYTAQIQGGGNPTNESVKKFMNIEEQFGLFDLLTYEKYCMKIASLKSQTQELLEKLKQQGKTIAGYGASITVTTLIYHFEIGSYIDCLLDDNVERQNLISPGLHLPVVNPSYLYENKPDYVVILAWRFADQIIRRHPDFKGQFIVPVPELRIV